MTEPFEPHRDPTTEDPRLNPMSGMTRGIMPVMILIMIGVVGLFLLMWLVIDPADESPSKYQPPGTASQITTTPPPAPSSR
jgi:hypothetical protein